MARRDVVRLLIPWREQFLMELMWRELGPGAEAPGTKRLPGGGIEAGESPTQTAIRELMEEFGEVVTESQLLLVAKFVEPQHSSEITVLRLEHHKLCPKEYTSTDGRNERIILVPGQGTDVNLTELTKVVFLNLKGATDEMRT